MYDPFSLHNQSRRVSTGADSSSSSIVTVRPSNSSTSSSGRRFVSAPIASPNAVRGVPDSSRRESLSYSRDTTSQLDVVAEDEARHITRWTSSSGSPNSSISSQKRDPNSTKRLSFRGSSFGTGFYNEAQNESPSKKSFSYRSGRGDEASPPQQTSVLSRTTSRRVTSGTDNSRTPRRPQLVSNVSSPSILGLSNRTIDSYQRTTSSSQANTHQPRDTLPLGHTAWYETPTHVLSPLQNQTNKRRSTPNKKQVHEVSERDITEDGIERAKSNGSKAKKSMLSRALKRANDAVGLDNAQDYSGAVNAYQEACECLKEVMRHSSNTDDREKLQQIRETYASRILELEQADSAMKPNALSGHEVTKSSTSAHRDKDLPALPFESPATSDPTESLTSSSQRARPDSFGTFYSEDDYDISFPPQAPENFSFDSDATEQDPNVTDEDFEDSGPLVMTPVQAVKGLLVDHRPPRVVSSLIPLAAPSAGEENALPATSPSFLSHELQPEVIRDTLRARDSDTEAAFNAALDAAVEAVYDEGYEPYQEDDSIINEEDGVSARTFVPYSDKAREAAIAAAAAQGSNLVQASSHGDDYRALDLGQDTEEEERLLEEITREFMHDNLVLDEGARSVLPRQSDSSTSSSANTWESSVASSVHTSRTTLSPVHEKGGLGFGGMFANGATSSIVPPSKALPPPPAFAPLQARTNASQAADGSTLLERRLSTAKRLQIRTVVDTRPPPKYDLNVQFSRPDWSDSSSAVTVVNKKTPMPGTLPDQTHDGVSGDSTATSIGSSNLTIPTSAMSSALTDRTGISTPLSSPTGIMTRTGFARPLLNREVSNISVKDRKPPLTSTDTIKSSLVTPSYSIHSAGSAASARPPLSSLTSSSSIQLMSLPPGSQFDFFVDIHNGVSGRLSKEQSADLPRPLEPCPEAALLRPLWLLRCVYQTIAHPRGGYLTSKLFVPRDVWKVQNVKLKGVEEKIAACDLVANALARLRKVNTLDADAVLEEMQYLEGIMDQAQAILSKKLGNDVGMKDLASSFKDAPPSSTSFDKSTSSQSADGGLNPLAASTSSTVSANKSGKNYLTTLGRRLRNKPSHNTFAGSLNSSTASQANTAYTLATIPMTSTSSLPPSRSGTSATRPRTTSSTLTPALSTTLGGRPLTEGPYVMYTSALARLCDSAQILDGIIRSAEDPGVKASGPTHVGLELGARHASEFLGLWVCRWVLADLGLLVDKFGKRAGEFLVDVR